MSGLINPKYSAVLTATYREDEKTYSKRDLEGTIQFAFVTLSIGNYQSMPWDLVNDLVKEGEL